MSGLEGSSTKREVPGAAGLPEFLVFTVYKKALALCQSFFIYEKNLFKSELAFYCWACYNVFAHEKQ